MQKKTTILIIVIIVLLLVGGVYWWWGSQQPKEGKPKAGIPPDYIVVENTSEGQIVKNTKKGISMKVPEGWEVNKFVVDKDLEIRKFGPGQDIETELVDGAILDVYITDNPENLKIEELVNSCPTIITKEGDKEIKRSRVDCNLSYELIGNTKVAKRTSKVTGEGEDENGDLILIDNSRQVEISFTKNKKVYTFSCKTAGENYENYSQECEMIIEDKIKNEF